ncbi:MAG TPA: hypothetical protein IAC74_01830 [Candidatus Aphodoplasma excrementigallinarum]|uniref:Uncharacterized protein n=1 Tax=Candidatus Aphodoplasma excrementigallinarum TaxID=2840673 RepID=A0A9D1NG87_9FIRM|nr:hypothetical protein [Candidatus Aphodoplasma excrementigallinarum]
MALYFDSAPAEQQYTLSSFQGADFTTQPSKVEPAYSPDMKNMLQNQNGYIEKRTGTRRILEAEGAINGIFSYDCPETGQTYRLIHIGTSLYQFTFNEDRSINLGSVLLTGLADKKSRGFTFGGACYLLGAGYVRIGYDEMAGALCYGFVNQASSVRSADTAPEIITGRSRSTLRMGPKLDGTAHDYCGHNALKRIVFAQDRYFFDGGTNPDRLYITGPEYKNRIRVDSLYMEDQTRGYFLVSEKQYSVKSDAGGLYVELSRTTIDVESSYFCAPYVIVEYDNSVYAPTVVTGRMPLRIGEVGGDVIDSDGQVTQDFIPFTGETLESANLASGLRSIDFYFDPKADNGFWGVNGTRGMRLYLTDALEGHVTGIYIDGVPVQSYHDSSGTEIVYSYRAQFADLAKSVFTEFTQEHVIHVTYVLTGEERDVIDNCSIYALYGGSNDTRAFLSGNAEYPARDFASGLYDASYFPDTGYTDVGAEESAIVGYHKLYGNLIIVKDGRGNDSAQYLRSFSLAEDGAGNVTPLFTVKQGNISYGASCVSSFKNVGGIPLYIGPDGVFAISGTNVENQNNTESVSRRVNGRLLNEPLQEAVCVSAGRRYYVFVGNHAYVCDVENGFIWAYFDDLPAVRCAWADGDMLCVGTDDGIVSRFMQPEEAGAYYDDVAVDGSVENARAIEAVWEIPQTVLGSYTNYKTIRNCYVTCMPYGRSGVKVYYNSNDDYRDWVLAENIDMFSFEDIDFSRFTFRTIAAPFVFATCVKAKNVYVFGLRLVNDTPGEPFGFLAVSIKYRIGKYVK